MNMNDITFPPGAFDDIFEAYRYNPKTGEVEMAMNICGSFDDWIPYSHPDMIGRIDGRLKSCGEEDG